MRASPKAASHTVPRHAPAWGRTCRQSRTGPTPTLEVVVGVPKLWCNAIAIERRRALAVACSEGQGGGGDAGGTGQTGHTHRGSWPQAAGWRTHGRRRDSRPYRGRRAHCSRPRGHRRTPRCRAARRRCPRRCRCCCASDARMGHSRPEHALPPRTRRQGTGTVWRRRSTLPRACSTARQPQGGAGAGVARVIVFVDAHRAAHPRKLQRLLQQLGLRIGPARSAISKALRSSRARAHNRAQQRSQHARAARMQGPDAARTARTPPPDRPPPRADPRSHQHSSESSSLRSTNTSFVFL